MSSDIAVDITDRQRLRLEIETSVVSEPGTWSGVCDECGEEYEEYRSHLNDCSSTEGASND